MQTTHSEQPEIDPGWGEDEEAIIDYVENGNPPSVENIEMEIERYQALAKAFNAEKRIRKKRPTE